MSSLKIVLFSVLLLSSVAVEATEQCARPIEVKAGEHSLKGCINSSDTATALLKRMPFTVTMANAHNIEMVYRFKEALPAENATRSSYTIGDIFYWTPKNALVIYYGQNGKSFDNLQKVGHIQTDVQFLEKVPEIPVSFLSR